MKELEDQHRGAMTLVDRALAARRTGDYRTAEGLFRQAFDAERAVAEAMAPDVDFEPTRSVLLRSAATLALDCDDWREAERLVAVALSGSPPEEIAEELRDVLEQAHFQRHLQLRGVELAPGEYQMSLSGAAVGHGFARVDHVYGRAKTVSAMVRRTAERQAGYPYRDHPRLPGSIQEGCHLYVAAPRAASVSVTVRVGVPGGQLDLFGDAGRGVEAMDEVMTCIALANAGEMSELGTRIADDAYGRNFIGLTRSLAPDGREVSQVGLTSRGPGGLRTVSLTRTRRQIGSTEAREGGDRGEGATEEVLGKLLYADATHPSERVRIVPIEGRVGAVEVHVPKGMLTDIVGPLWNKVVRAQCHRLRNRLLLDDIEAVESPS